MMQNVIVLCCPCVVIHSFMFQYTTYLEGLGRHEDVRNVYMRACRQHLPYKASIHITWAFYEERQGVLKNWYTDVLKYLMAGAYLYFKSVPYFLANHLDCQ